MELQLKKKYLSIQKTLNWSMSEKIPNILYYEELSIHDKKNEINKSNVKRLNYDDTFDIACIKYILIPFLLIFYGWRK